MLTFQPDKFIACNLSQMNPGNVFFIRETGQYHLSVLLEASNNNFLFLPMTGKRSFQFQTADVTRSPPKVLRLPVSTTDLRIRVDHHSGIPDAAEAGLGKLVVCPEHGPCITAEWPGHEDDGYCNALRLSDWSQAQVGTVRFAFQKWALSYLDESNSWVDVIIST